MSSHLSTRTTLLLNWYANPYHTPIFVAEQLGFYSQENIKLAILEPTDPSDVTELVGLGTVDFGVKAMIHTVAAKAKGYPMTSIGTLLDEPPTGLRWILKIGHSLKQRLLIADLLKMTFKEVHLFQNPDCKLCLTNNFTRVKKN